MAAVLERIVAATRARVAEVQARSGLARIGAAGGTHVPRGFRRALASKSREGVGGNCGVEESFAVERIDSSGVSSGGAGDESWSRRGRRHLSVLTDEEFFQGSLENLREASAAVSIPCSAQGFHYR